MVLFMTTYNMATRGLFGSITFIEFVVQLLLTFVVAFCLELFVVGPVAKKIAFSLPYNKSNKLLVILTLSLSMVIGMVLCMSLYGWSMAYFSDGTTDQSMLQGYVSLILKNFIFAFPLQLIVVGPLVRFLFAKFVKRKGVHERSLS